MDAAEMDVEVLTDIIVTILQPVIRLPEGETVMQEKPAKR